MSARARLARSLPTWSTSPAHPMRFDRNLVEMPRYAEIERSMASVAREVVAALESGELTKPQAMSAFRDALREHETAAFVAGRRARGDLRDTLTEAEERMLNGRHSRNMRYFSGFCDDVQEGSGRMPYPRRAEAYAKSLWSIYSRGETLEWGDDHDGFGFVWVLDPEAEHCRDCLRRAAESRATPYTWEQLVEIGFPGESTVCLYECRCHLRRVKLRERVASPPTAGPEPYEEPAAPNASAGLERIQEILGGPELPKPAPAAGVPFVRITPEAVSRSAAAADDAESREELLMRLPQALNVLARPSSVLDAGMTRIYSNGVIGVATERGDDGVWRAVLIVLAARGAEEDGRRD